MSNRTYQGPPIDMTYNHLSERDGQTVGGTTDDDKGEVKTDSWPESAPPKDELNEDRVAVVEAVADPTREWDSMAEMSREVVPHRSDNYVACFLNQRWPEGHAKIIEDGRDGGYTCKACDKTFNRKTSLTAHKASCKSRPSQHKSAEEIEEMRQALLDGITTSELSDRFDISKKQVRRLTQGKYDYIPEDDIDLPPLVSPGRGPNSQYKLPDGYENTDTATQATLDEPEEESEPQPEPEPQPQPEAASITSDSGTTDKRSNQLRTVALAILAFIFGWAINK